MTRPLLPSEILLGCEEALDETKDAVEFMEPTLRIDMTPVMARAIMPSSPLSADGDTMSRSTDGKSDIQRKVSRIISSPIPYLARQSMVPDLSS
mmetsp:Transcript_83303/g.220993  ORF Transcript_83303/g.220993 Transcript_83303/m.220993 type:complete len:94 (-) Transcript_83303:90-371(-)